ncbi:hypothetical protein BDW22DRAFT_1362336 [Trametopsis cervina]|nr:hypothetical protein BDW22DRAFT_1362336 [Trametopsis cervina]
MPPVSVPRAPLHERQIHIPFELIERFLSFVATFDRNKKTHLACSLTCREWRAVCMPFLFSSMSAHHPDRLIALLTLGRDDRSRNFACSVRKLELADGIMTAKLFISILETFPKLRCLWLDGVRFELASSSELPPGHPTFELDTLIIDGRLHDPPYLLDVHVLLDAFRAFAHINTLYLSGPSAETSFRPPPKEPRSSLQLQVHNIAGPVPARLWLSLLRCTRTIEDQTLQTVRIDVEHSATEEFGELLSTGGANLRSVDIGFSRGPYSEFACVHKLCRSQR